MRNDAPPQPDPNLPGPPARDEAQSATPPRALASGIQRVKVPALLILVGATCWVVADLASVWLVPPYLGAVVLILWPSPQAIRRRGGASGIDSPTTAHARSTDPDCSAADNQAAGGLADGGNSAALPGASGSAAGGATAPDSDGDAGPATATATATARAKRGRGRPRKASKPSAEPIEVVEATWVEVGPGKFVRGEGPSVGGPVAGPHLAVEPAAAAPTEPDPSVAEGATPALAEAEPTGSAPAVDPEALPGLGFIFRYHPAASPPPSVTADPPVEVAPSSWESPTRSDDAPASLAAESWIRPAAVPLAAEFVPEPAAAAATADGIAPQVAGSEEWVAADEPTDEDAAPAPDLDLAGDADWPSTEPVEQPCSSEFDPWDASDEPAADFPEPTDAFAPGLTAHWDAADAAEPVAPDEASRQDFTPDDEVEDQDAVDGLPPVPAASRSWRQTQAFRPRRAGPSRGSRRSVPPGRSGRPDRSARRPTDPRRPPGRRAGRPRQITRTSPPRSPPTTRWFR